MKTKQDHIEMAEDDFYETYTQRENHLDDNASFNGAMYETYGEEVGYVRKNIKSPRLWTIVECEEGLYYMSGYHYVNRLGYFFTEQDVLAGVQINVQIDVQLDENF